MHKLLPAKELGERLRAERKKRGWTQPQFAAETKRDQSEISRWENGRVQPEYDTVVMLAKALGVPVDNFLDRGNGSDGQDARVSGAMQEIEASGGMTEVERYYLEELRRISAAEAPEGYKIMARDSLASSIARLGNIIAERAGEARARAIEKAETAGESRAKAIERAEETANVRTLVLGGERSLTSSEVMDLVSRMLRERGGGAEGATGTEG